MDWNQIHTSERWKWVWHWNKF